MPYPFVLAVDPAGDLPVFVQIANGLVAAIQRGRLAPGARLPGSRTLARSVDVHRNTVLAAYAELLSQGWIVGSAGRGTFVSERLPEAKPRRIRTARRGLPESTGFALRGPAPARAARPWPPGTLPFGFATPDLRLAPVAELARAYRRAVCTPTRAALEYGSARGHPRLRHELANMLRAARGIAASAEDVLVTRGSQMAFYLTARALIEPGDVVAVESFGYEPAWKAFRSAGAELVPIAVDDHGLVVRELGALALRRKIRAVYVTPHHQYPTLAVLSADRRLALLDLARQHRFAVIEDDYDNEIHFEGRPVLPLASTAEAGNVVYIGSLSKVLAPGIRVGYVVAPRPLIDRMAEIRRTIDRHGDPAVELAVSELLEDGILPRHVRRMRRVFERRRDVLGERLRAHLGSVLEFDLPSGGLALWARVRQDIDVEAWAERALLRGVYVRPPSEYALDGSSRPFLRLSYAPLTEQEIDEAVRRLVKALTKGR